MISKYMDWSVLFSDWWWLIVALAVLLILSAIAFFKYEVIEL